MRDMREGHVAFFYHSNCKEPGIAGCMEVRARYSRRPPPPSEAFPALTRLASVAFSRS